MKIVQTLWTKPGLNAGWLDKKFHFMSWALSCLQLCKFYERVEIYTDKEGQQLLIEEFGLPYSRVHTVLTHFDYPSYLWAAPKLLTYGLQDEPFLHVDGDVYLFSPISEECFDSDFVYQNLEQENESNGFYTRIIREFISLERSRSLPDWIADAPLDHIEAVNAGVFGGKHNQFFKTLSENAFAFFSQHSEIISRLFNPSFANHVAEQVLAEHLCKKMGLKRRPLFGTNKYLNPRVMKNITEIENIVTVFNKNKTLCFSKEVLSFAYMILDHFGISPLGRQYVHMIGSCKKNLALCNMLSRRLLVEYPQYYHRINNYFDRLKQHGTGQGLQRSAWVAEGSPVAQQIKTPASQARCSLREKVSTAGVDKLFERTISLHKILLEKVPDTALDLPGFVSQLEAELERLPNEHYRDRLRDLFKYEQERYQFALSPIADSELDRVETMSCQSLDLLQSTDQPDINDYTIMINPFICFVITKWNWSDDDCYLAAYVPPGEVSTVLYIDNATKRLVELEMSPLSKMVLFVYAAPSDFSSGFEELKTFVDVSDEKRLKEQFFQCVIYLIANSVLLVQKKYSL
jgi:hypothetical protein